MTSMETFEKAKIDCNELGTMVKGMQDRILIVLEVVLGKEVNNDKDINVNGLKDKMKAIFFRATGSISEDHLENSFSFMTFMNSVHDQGPEWERIFATCTTDLALMEYKVEAAPSAPMEELDVIMSRFIEFAIQERDKWHTFLEDSLL